MACQRCLVMLALSLGVVPIARGALHYVSPAGTGSGTQSNPSSLQNAIGSGSPARAGDTIYLRGGTYTGAFTCSLSAPSNNPIVVRNYNGERAILDANCYTENPFTFQGSGIWVRGLEIMNSATNRYVVRGDGVGFNTSLPGSNNKLINSIIHDCGDGAFVSYQSTNAEITGCVIYNNGYQLADRGHGHNLYVQNRSYAVSKLFQENIGLNAYNVGLNCRSSFQTVNMVFQGNVMVNSGSNSTNGWASNFHTEGSTCDRIVFTQNFNWYPSQIYGGIFYNPATNGTITLVSNVFANTYSQIIWWTNVVFNYNTQAVSVDIRSPQTNTLVLADHNYYYNVPWSKPVYYKDSQGAGKEYTLAAWQAAGNDINGTSTASAPSGSWIYVRPNPYETGRANIIIYNWSTNDNVSVDASRVLSAGMAYQVRNAADYFGPLVASGLYDGGTISVPMTNLSVAIPIGKQAAPAPTGPKFNVFVLLSLPSRGLLPPSSLRVLETD